MIFKKNIFKNDFQKKKNIFKNDFQKIILKMVFEI